MARPNRAAGGDGRGQGADPLAGLTYKQRQFVEAYLGAANGNATEAARIAGYQWPDRLGARLVGKSSIRVAIDARLADSALPTSEILARLSDMATGSIEDFITINAKGGYRVDFAKAKRLGKLHLIKEIRPTKEGVAIKLHDAKAALDQLGKFRGLWDSKGQTDDESVSAFVRAVQQLAEQGSREKAIEPPR